MRIRFDIVCACVGVLALIISLAAPALGRRVVQCGGTFVNGPSGTWRAQCGGDCPTGGTCDDAPVEGGGTTCACLDENDNILWVDPCCIGVITSGGSMIGAGTCAAGDNCDTPPCTFSEQQFPENITKRVYFCTGSP